MDEAFSADLAGGLVAAPESHIVLAQWSDPGGEHDPPRFIAPLHVHHADDEAWYVVEGALCVRIVPIPETKVGRWLNDFVPMLGISYIF